MKKKLLTESQMRRMATIAGIPALGGIVGRISEKLDIQTEDGHEEEKAEETNEEVVVEEEEMEMEPEMEEPAGEEVSQDKIESLVDAVLAAIEAETGVPAERVDSEEEAPAEEPEMEMDAEPEMDAEEPEMDAEEEMMETVEPTLAERIAQAVQSILDENAEGEEDCDEAVDEAAHEAVSGDDIIRKVKQEFPKAEVFEKGDGEYEVVLNDPEMQVALEQDPDMQAWATDEFGPDWEQSEDGFVIFVDGPMQEGYGKKMEEDEVEENTATDDDTLEEITKAVVARLRSLK